jgi:hypothetical protein
LITFQRLAKYVGAEPFRPFRINTSSGQAYEIRHPEMISVGRTTAHIYAHMSDDAELAKQREFEVSMLLMESIEPLDVASAQEGKH